MPTSIVNGFTEWKSDGIIYRAHPCYRTGMAWNDWVLIRFSNYPDPLPARIMMFLDLRESTFMSSKQHERFLSDKDPELPEEEWSSASSSCNYVDSTHSELDSSDSEDESTTVGLDDQTCVTNGIYCIVQCADSPVVNHTELGEYHMKSRIMNRFKLEVSYRIIEIESLESPCFVVMDNPMVNFEENSGEIGFYVKDPETWSAICFLDTSSHDEYLL